MNDELELNPTMDLDTALIILKVFAYCDTPLPFVIKDKINYYLEAYQKDNLRDRKRFTKAINKSGRMDSSLLESNLEHIDMIISVQLQYEEMLK
jgi:hypothetical protein